MTDDPTAKYRPPSAAALARLAGVPPPPRLAHPLPHVEPGDTLPGSATAPERDAGRCSCGRPARIDQELCGYCLPQTTQPPDGVRWVRGKFSDALARTNLLADYQRSLMDTNYLSVREYGAVLDARLGELFERLTESLKSHHWTDAAKEYRSMRGAELTGDATEEGKARARLEALFQQGAIDERTWDQIMATMELRRKLSDTEAKNAERLQNMLSVPQAVQLITTIVTILKRKLVDHQDLLNEIVIEIRATAAGDGGDRYNTYTITPGS